MPLYLICNQKVNKNIHRQTNIHNTFMKIILHNPAHNGDVFFSSKIVEFIIKNNPTYEFIIAPSCSSILFEHLVSEKVTIETNPHQWNFDYDSYNDCSWKCANNRTDYTGYLYSQHDILWSIHKDDLYINMWQLMIKSNNNCMDLTDKTEFIQKLFKEIHEKTGIVMNFGVFCAGSLCEPEQNHHSTQGFASQNWCCNTPNHYKELIPEIPQLDISFIRNDIMLPIYKTRIFFFNFMGKSSQETLPPSFNDEYINELINKNPDSIIIVPDTCSIKHTRLISLLDDYNIQKEISGRSLVIYANICNICDEVHFKNNGGSLFTMNTININNKNVKYYYLNEKDFFYDTMKNCYGLNIVN